MNKQRFISEKADYEIVYNPNDDKNDKERRDDEKQGVIAAYRERRKARLDERNKPRRSPEEVARLQNLMAYYQRRKARLDAAAEARLDPAIKAYRERRQSRISNVRMDDDDDDGGGKGGNTTLPYGIAKSEGIDTTGMTPSEVWAALGKRGYSAKEEYKKLGGKGSTATRPKLPEAQSKAINNIVKRTANLKKEQYRIVSPDGKILVESKGDKGSVGTTVGEKRDAFWDNEGSVSIHNHPEGGTFSSADLKDFGFGAAEIYATSPEGTYILTAKDPSAKGRSGWYDMQEKLANELDGKDSTTAIRKRAEQSPNIVALDKEISEKSAITLQQMNEMKANGATTDEINEFVSKSEAYKLMEQRRVEFKKELRRQEVAPYDEFYKKNADKYGFIYTFVPNGKRMDADEESNNKGGSGGGGGKKGGGGNTRLPYGIAQSEGIDTTGMTPSEVWEVLGKRGYSAKEAYKGLKQGKRGAELKGTAKGEEPKGGEAAPAKPKTYEEAKAELDKFYKNYTDFAFEIAKAGRRVEELEGAYDKLYASGVRSGAELEKAEEDYEKAWEEYHTLKEKSRQMEKQYEQMKEDVRKNYYSDEIYEEVKRDFGIAKENLSHAKKNYGYKKSELESCERDLKRALDRRDSLVDPETGELYTKLDDVKAKNKETRDRADETYREVSKLNDLLYDRPARGTPEREAYDKQLEEMGGRDAVEAKYDQLLKEHSKLLDLGSKYSRMVSLMQNWGEDVGVNAAQRDLAVAQKEHDKIKEKYDARVAEVEKLSALYKDKVMHKFPTYKDCKTHEDVAERLTATGSFREGKAVNFDNIDLNEAVAAAEQVDKMFERFPMLKGKLGAVSTGSYKSNTIAYSSPSGVVLCEKYYKDSETLRATAERCEKSGWHPPGAGKDGFLWHEYGHQLDDWMTYNVGFGVSRGNPKAFSQVVFEEVRKNLKMSAHDCKLAVSGYAADNKSGGAKEFLAEAFSEYCCSENPRPVAMEVGKIIERYLKDIK